MHTPTEKDLTSGLEEGYKLVALQPAEGIGFSLPIYAVVRAFADPAAGRFVLARDTPQARVFLGCTADAALRPQEWLELWVQKTEGLGRTDTVFGEHLTNTVWDARWRDLAEALRRTDPASVLSTPLERGHLPPAFLDAEAAGFVPLAESEGGQALRLCTDDAVLADAGLPTYAGSPHRYLHAPGIDPAAMRFYRVRADSPTNDRTQELGAILPPGAEADSLGLDGGSVVVRRFAPLSLEEFSGVVGGRAWKGMDNARRIFRVPGVYKLLEDEESMRCGSAHLFTSTQGRSGRLSEALYLKLQMVSQAFRLVRAHVAGSQLPFLNLTADSFRVRLGATGLGLPFLWTGHADLARPGGAYALPLRNTAVRYFQSLEPLTASVYRPGFVGIARRGTANVRVRKIFPPTAEGLALEGTIRSAERLSNDENDLLSIHLPLSEGNADLLGHIDFTQARSEGEAVFRTVPQSFAPALLAALQGTEGSAFTGLTFDILSPLSTPFDMYSLGVVTLRLLLASDANPLPDALDRAFSLAHEVAQNPDGGSLEDRIALAFDGDPRWREALGYQHSLHTTTERDAGDATLPPRLWWSTLAWVLRLFPKLLPESFCKGYGDAPPLALETVFDAPARELNTLLLRWRTFLLGGWRQNQEIAGVITTISNEV